MQQNRRKVRGLSQRSGRLWEGCEASAGMPCRLHLCMLLRSITADEPLPSVAGRPWYPSVDAQFGASCTKAAHQRTSFFGAGLVNAAAAVKPVKG